MTTGQLYALMALLVLVVVAVIVYEWRRAGREQFTGDLARTVDDLMDEERMATPQELQSVEEQKKRTGERGDI